MCGIFGVTIHKNSEIDKKSVRQLTDNLFKFSESRGKEAAGLALKSEDLISVYKSPISASKFIKSENYKKIFKNLALPTTLIGHSRLVTDGVETTNENNQPVVKNSLVGIHNGIVTNVKVLWAEYPELDRKYEVDTEIILELINYFYLQTKNLKEAVEKTFEKIEGAASIAILSKNFSDLVLATNTGSLYTCQGLNNKIFVFASEKYILNKLCKKHKFLNEKSILQIKPNQIKIIETGLIAEQINVKGFDKNKLLKKNNLEWNKNLLEYTSELNLKRCTKCVLPETFPGIKFDKNGVCNLCQTHVKYEPEPEEKLEKIMNQVRSQNGRPDCLVALSGGRDSSYVLHYIKKVLKMNPIAFSYDWGMLTDLGRRNQARMCGKLGVEHILVSADIRKKRKNIQKNVLAWLKKPDLGMIPLFMAGDKQYFYYVHKLKKQLGIDLVILGENPLEKTNFKTAFAGVKLEKEKGIFYALDNLNKIKIVSYYLKQFLINPSYLNSSIWDTIFAFIASFLIPHNYLNLYKYVKWDEEKINSVLINEYNWELSPDTTSTWRIGDGTASFYNYIYYTLAGFTENDTFRSNQVREEILTREEALGKIKNENNPRAESIKWYCNTIRVNFNQVIKKINVHKKLY